MPALLTSTSSRPNSVERRSTSAARSAAAPTSPCTATARPPAAAISVDHLVGRVGARGVVDDHGVTQPGQFQGDRPADPPRSSRDQCRPPVGHRHFLSRSCAAAPVRNSLAPHPTGVKRPRTKVSCSKRAVPRRIVDPGTTPMSRMLRFALVLFVLALPAAASAADSTSPPNVVLIIGDDQGWTDYGFMGHPADPDAEPRPARVAEASSSRAATSPRASAGRAWPRSSPACYPHQHKITCNDPPRADLRRSADDRSAKRPRSRSPTSTARATLPALLGQNGYSASRPASGGKATTAAAASPTA